MPLKLVYSREIHIKVCIIEISYVDLFAEMFEARRVLRCEHSCLENDECGISPFLGFAVVVVTELPLYAPIKMEYGGSRRLDSLIALDRMSTESLLSDQISFQDSSLTKIKENYS